MIQKYIERFDGKRAEILAHFKNEHPKDYKDVVQAVIKAITSDEYSDIDPDRIHQIDDGHYQGTLVFVIACKGYQPDKYWYVKVWYGSCSGCDTLERIRHYEDNPPTDEQAQEYFTLALHILQGLKEMSDGE